MRFVRVSALLLSVCLLAACAVNKSAKHPSVEYVEVPNPALTMSPDAPETIWVPKSYVESGVPRGGEMVKRGYETAKAGMLGAPAQPVPGAARPAAAICSVMNRLAVMEIGQPGLAAQFAGKLKSASAGVPLDQSQGGTLAPTAPLASRSERSAFAARAWQDAGANLTVFALAPDGISPGKTLIAEIYDGMGSGLLRSVDAPIPPYAEAEPAAREAAVTKALATLAEKVKEVVALVPWFGKIVAVEGDRVYINAGREAGINIGQKLAIYRGGKVVEGLGFAPGEKVGMLEIAGFVGPNGAYGVVRKGEGVHLTDLVGVQ